MFINGSSGGDIKHYTFGGVTFPAPITGSNATFGYWETTDTTPKPDSVNLSSETEFGDGGNTNNNYTNVSSVDEVFASHLLFGATNRFVAHKFTFKINESESDVSKLTIFWNGTGGELDASPQTDANLSIWNSSDWEIIGNCTAPGIDPNNHPGCVVNHSITTNIANYIDETDNNAVYILAISNKETGSSIQSIIRTNYIELNVTTKGENPLSCGSMSQDDKCQLNFTINASGDVGSYLVLDVNFSSDDSNVVANDTEDHLIKIVAPVVPADTTPPIVNTTFNISQTTIRINDIINVTANATDSGNGGGGLAWGIIGHNMSGTFKNYTQALSGAATTVEFSQNITVNLIRGNVINFSVVVNDTADPDNQALNDTIITVANTPATNATIVFPPDNFITNIQPLELNVTFAADPDTDVINISYYLDGVLEQNNITNITVTLADGTYILNVSLFDNVTGADPSANQTINFTIDTVVPVVNTTLNESLTNIGLGDVINITANATDEFQLSFVQFVINASPAGSELIRYFNFSFEGQREATNVSQNITIDCNGGCVINFTARVNDTAGNYRTNDTIITLIDKINPVVNATLNESLTDIKQNDVINLTANVTDNLELSFGQIIVNASPTGSELTRYFNFSLEGKTEAEFSQNITIDCAAGCVINFTARTNDTTNKFRTNDTIIEVASAAAPDTTFPIVNTTFNITTPYVYDVINFTGNVTDTGDGLLSANITINFSAGTEFFNYSFTGTPATGQISNDTDLTGKTKAGDILNFTMFVTDANNNVAQNSTLLTVALNCRDLDRPNFIYNLSQDVESDATCFYVQANNITLDCKGFEINYSQVDVGYGVNISSQNFTTIRSCDIVQADIGSDNSNAYGVYLFDIVTGTSVFNNSINTLGSSSHVIVLSIDFTNNSIYNNTISTSGSSAQGILLDSLNSVGANNSIYSNTIKNSGSGRTGIFIDSTSDSNFVYNNTIALAGTNVGKGIRTRSSNENSIYGNTITTNVNKGYGIYMEGGTSSGSLKNTVYDNNITTSGTNSPGIFLENGMYNNTIYNNNITTKNSDGTYGIYLLNNINNNTFYGNIISSLAIGILINGSGQAATEETRFNTFTNDTIITCTTGCASNYQDVILTANATDITFLNVSFNKSRIAIIPRSIEDPAEINNLTVQWYLDITVDDGSSPIEGAQVVINDSNAFNLFNDTTDSNGNIPTQTITGYTQNGSATFDDAVDTCIGVNSHNVTCFTPHNISVNTTGFNPGDLSIDINRSKIVTISLVSSVDNTPPVVNATFNISQTTIRINDIINITANATDSGNGGGGLAWGIIGHNMSGTFKNYTQALTGAATTVEFSQNITINLTRGNVINFSVVVNDTADPANFALNDTIITVANTPATNATIVFPPFNDFKTNIQPLALNVTFAADPDTDVINISFYIDGALEQNKITNITFTGADGTYILNVSLFDNVTGAAPSANVSINFTIDTTIPVVNATLNESFTNIGKGDVINITANVTDEFQLSFVQFIINASPAGSELTRYFNFSFEGQREATNVSQNITIDCNGGCVINFTVRVNDTAGNFRTNDTIITVVDKINPIVNTTLNKSYTNIFQNDIINLTANATDNIGLSFGQIIVNASPAGSELVRIFNFSLDGATEAQFSQNISIDCAAGCVINFTARVNDTSNRFTTNDTIITVQASTAAPTVKLDNLTGFNIDPTSGSSSEIIISFNATDTNGLEQINGTTGGKVSVNLTLGTPGFSQFRTQSSCTNITNETLDLVTFTCIINMRYYDNASAAWVINISVEDSDNVIGMNDSSGSTPHIFTYNVLAAFSLTSRSVTEDTNLNFTSLFVNDQNIVAKAPILLNNTGNDDFDQINITGANLELTTDNTKTIAIGSFFVNVTNNTVGEAFTII